MAIRAISMSWEPKDTKLMVDFTNQLIIAIKHPIAWVHMPVPREREDVA